MTRIELQHPAHRFRAPLGGALAAALLCLASCGGSSDAQSGSQAPGAGESAPAASPAADRTHTPASDVAAAGKGAEAATPAAHEPADDAPAVAADRPAVKESPFSAVSTKADQAPKGVEDVVDLEKDGVLAREGPRLSYALGKETKDFGRLLQGEVADHTFELESNGTEDLMIRQIKPTCGCTVAQIRTESDDGEMLAYEFGDPIPPGRKVIIPTTLNTAKKHGHATTRINIFSNDPRGTIQLGLEADIDPFFTLNPTYFNFGQIKVGDVVTKSSRISIHGGQAVALEVTEDTRPANAQVELIPLQPDAEGRSASWEFKVTLGPDLVEGNLGRAVTLRSDVEIPGTAVTPDGHSAQDGHDHGASFHEAVITISARVVGPFTYSPNYLSMGLVRPGQVVSRTVRVEAHDDDYSFAEHMPTAKILGLPVPGTGEFKEWEYADLFSVVVRPVDNVNAVDVELRLDGLPETATGSFRGTLALELDHPDKKSIELTITGVCRGGAIKQAPSNADAQGDSQR